MRSSAEVAQQLLLGWKFNGRMIELSIKSRDVDITSTGKVIGVSATDLVFKLSNDSGEIRLSLDGLTPEPYISSNGSTPVSLVLKSEGVFCVLIESGFLIADYPNSV